MKDLSIIIVNTNNKKILRECLASIFQNTHKPSLEVIVSDNGSKDGSQEMVKTSFPQIILIENGENLGFIKATNKGLKISTGRYVCLLNDDTITKDSAFDKMVEFMEKSQKKIGCCAPTLLNVDGTFQHQGGLLQKKFWLSNEPVEISFAIGACLLLRREVMDKIGYLDEKLFFYNDDLDYCIRIKKAGYKIYFVPSAKIMHYGGYSSKRSFNRKLFVEGVSGGLYFARKHYGLFAYILYRLILFICLLIFIPFLIISYPFKRKKFLDRLMAYFDILGICVFLNSNY
ncbi:hypothetical protein A3J90_05200 [candidate division WOR-1 bacterium RIFOXYC2_FULL_37_10]|uniref:Glycosyltransferase 2-like domain-containing protein n=1 Tax=candidate division WOR-1 bacterium RIFOXYB2_FULL_37_13 TaxID=1802579 RepID=A0A1F4SUT7_UNCSA|nr:MAG: hypothetical protein A2246_03390 [candidate division WOR-1 bacterium RIFOXYA2_FULL_37_7]OGC24194.1 MAG: hypothetical protein A2310_06585 [candidate division WOR-1 bacterium RIFOXYB2_FULL_37_13]OGC32370.1 MAG: hypothetical protein A3J90_05200 [candidate division WOR-1 bacterium RIFOXYC2_FULL_37_10]